MKGIVLAGGTGSRLWPITRSLSKQLLPVYDKPLIHYPIGTLLQAGIREILIITTPEDKSTFQNLLGDGSNYGVSFTFETQSKPNGLAEAFLIAEDFIENDSSALILGDNIFHGSAFEYQIKTMGAIVGARIFAYEVSNPRSYGIVEFDRDRKIVSLEEKPIHPKSNFAIPGLYFYDSEVVEIAKSIKPSVRGEIEITAINDIYLKLGKLNVQILERGTTWLDTGTFETLHSASSYVKIIEERQGNKISCLEEIAWRKNWITSEELLNLANEYGGNPYGKYLLRLLNNGTTP